jgi:hypothetical protein
VADVEEAAWLLRALNGNQAHGREGAAVNLGDQEAGDAGLRPGSSLYRVVAVGQGGVSPRPRGQRASQECSRSSASRLRIQPYPTRPGHAARGVTDGADERRHQQRGPNLSNV